MNTAGFHQDDDDNGSEDNYFDDVYDKDDEDVDVDDDYKKGGGGGIYETCILALLCSMPKAIFLTGNLYFETFYLTWDH